MNNTTRAKKRRQELGEFEKYLHGDGIDVGCGNDPLVVPNGRVRGWDVRDGDAMLLGSVPDRSLDFVYSSHCLEHLRDVRLSIENWSRVLRPNGFLYTVVPDYCIYEKLNWPSRFNGDHKHSFSMDLTRRKVKRANHFHIDEDVRPILEKLGHQILEVRLEDDGYDYSRGFVDQTFDDSALCQICVISRRK